jgi:hypothetical protein
MPSEDTEKTGRALSISLKPRAKLLTAPVECDTRETATKSRVISFHPVSFIISPNTNERRVHVMDLGRKVSWAALLCCCLLIACAGAALAGEWVVDGKQKVKVWNSSPAISAEWSGGAKDGYADGKGVIKWFEDGVLNEKIEGVVNKGKPEGKCTFEVYNTKSQVVLSGEADFKDGAPNGRAVLRWVDGRTYEGEMKNGKENGKGVMTWQDGTRYDGDFKDGAMTGKACFTEPDGTKYEGDYLNGLLNGQGVLQGPDGSCYKGEFSRGLMNGKGVMTWKNGSRYEGEYRDGLMSGKGIMTSKDGRKYEGDFLYGLPNGQGTLTIPGKRVQKGTFENGRFVGK